MIILIVYNLKIVLENLAQNSYDLTTEAKFLIICEWPVNELSMSCDLVRHELFGILSHLWMA